MTTTAIRSYLGRSMRALTEASIAEEEYRVALSLIYHYMQ